jgi:hypothetical protein
LVLLKIAVLELGTEEEWCEFSKFNDQGVYCLSNLFCPEQQSISSTNLILYLGTAYLPLLVFFSADFLM